MTLLSATILLFVVMDPFGNIPLFVTMLGELPERRRRKLLGRELLIAQHLVPVLGKRVLCAIEKLMGLLLTVVAVEMLIGGLRQVLL